MAFKKLIKSSVLFFLMVVTFSVYANNSPVAMLENTANKIVSELQKNKADLRSNPKISYNIVSNYLVPMVDQEAMAQAVLGRNVWNNSTSSQKKAFISEFRILVVRTYAAAIAQFSDETIKFMPIRGQLNQSPLTVKSEIIRTNAPSVPVSYTLIATGNTWKVVDFSVDGISMVQSFKSQFQNQLNSGGMAELITTLKMHNAKHG